jgi:hypothetical protein
MAPRFTTNATARQTTPYGLLQQHAASFTVHKERRPPVLNYRGSSKRPQADPEGFESTMCQDDVVPAAEGDLGATHRYCKQPEVKIRLDATPEEFNPGRFLAARVDRMLGATLRDGPAVYRFRPPTRDGK